MWECTGANVAIANGGTLTLSDPAGIFLSNNPVDNDGEIEFTDNGTFDANAGFLSDGTGIITFHNNPGAGGTLQLAATDPDLGSNFTASEGTVEYDLKYMDYDKAPWARKTSTTEIDHKDGNRTNNDLSNLEELCQCCHKEKGIQAGDFKRQKYVYKT